jgi:hypothetical protein
MQQKGRRHDDKRLSAIHTRVRLPLDSNVCESVVTVTHLHTVAFTKESDMKATIHNIDPMNWFFDFN